MAAQTDLWGDLAPVEVRPPVALLREQAAVISTKTKNLIQAKVVTDATLGEIRHRFILVVPALGNYSYQMFRIEHDVNLYPVTIETEPPIMLATERDFMDWLRDTLSSEHTKKILANLLAQVVS
jgi:hypothetical protein